MRDTVGVMKDTRDGEAKVRKTVEDVCVSEKHESDTRSVEAALTQREGEREGGREREREGGREGGREGCL